MLIDAFIAARLDEDEAAARVADGGSPAPWRAADHWLVHAGNMSIALTDGSPNEHIARHDPARVLREVAAKRAILAEHGPLWEGDDSPCKTLRALAAVWADHADYDPAWA